MYLSGNLIYSARSILIISYRGNRVWNIHRATRAYFATWRAKTPPPQLRRKFLSLTFSKHTFFLSLTFALLRLVIRAAFIPMLKRSSYFVILLPLSHLPRRDVYLSREEDAKQYPLCVRTRTMYGVLDGVLLPHFAWYTRNKRYRLSHEARVWILPPSINETKAHLIINEAYLKYKWE